MRVLAPLLAATHREEAYLRDRRATGDVVRQICVESVHVQVDLRVAF